MCENCEARYGFDLGYGCSANTVEAADRYVQLKEEVEKIAQSPQTDVRTQFKLRESISSLEEKII